MKNFDTMKQAWNDLPAEEQAEFEAIAEQLDRLATLIHQDNEKWWTDLETGERIDRNEPEMIALEHSELSEALEAVRKGLQDDKLPHRLGVEVELADCIIRILDHAKGKGYNLADALIEKMLFNRARADHKIENRRQAGGKRF